MPRLLGRSWAVAARGTGFSAAWGARHPIIAHYQSLLEKYGVLYTLHLTPNSSLGPWLFSGGPHFLCQWCGAFWNV